MTFSIDSSGIVGDAGETAARLQILADLLARLAMGQLPSQTELREAPLLTNWRLTTRPALCLIGHCRDHPYLRGPRIITSDLWVHGPDLGWSRTLSRSTGSENRLGAPTRRGCLQAPV
jgi:hypothetical protein